METIKMKIWDKKDIKIKEKTIFSIICFFLALTGIVFGVLSFGSLRNQFIQNNFILLSIIWSIIIALIFSVALWGELADKETVAKTLLTLLIFIAFSAILVYTLYATGFFQIINDAESLQKYLKGAGVWMTLAYIILQYLQVVILPIPSVVSTIAGVALFGAGYASIYSLIGIILGSITAFFIGRKIGYKAVVWLVGKENLDKWQKKLKGKDNLFLTLMFILPMFPDDILCFLAGLSSMTTRYFLIMIIASRILSVSSTCFSFNFIPFNTWWGLLIWVILITAMLIIFILLYKNVEKIQKLSKKWIKIFGKSSGEKK